MWAAHISLQSVSDSQTAHQRLIVMLHDKTLSAQTLLDRIQDKFRNQLSLHCDELLTPSAHMSTVVGQDTALGDGRLRLAQETANSSQSVRCEALCIALPTREHALPWPAVELWGTACQLQAYAVPVDALPATETLRPTYYKMHSLEVNGRAVSSLQLNAEMRRNTGGPATGSVRDTAHRTFRKQSKTDHNTFALLGGIAPEKMWPCTNMHLSMWKTLLVWTTEVVDKESSCNVYSYFVKF